MRQLYVRTCVLACVRALRAYVRTHADLLPRSPPRSVNDDACSSRLPRVGRYTPSVSVVCPVLAAKRRLCQSAAPCGPLHAACSSRLSRVGRYTLPVPVGCPVWAATRRLCQSSAPCWPLHAACASRLPRVGRYTPPAAVVCLVSAATRRLQQSSAPCGPLHAACSSRLPRVGRYTPPAAVVCPVWPAKWLLSFARLVSWAIDAGVVSEPSSLSILSGLQYSSISGRVEGAPIIQCRLNHARVFRRGP